MTIILWILLAAMLLVAIVTGCREAVNSLEHKRYDAAFGIYTMIIVTWYVFFDVLRNHLFS